MEHQQHALRFLTLCLTSSPDSPNFWEQREGKVQAISFYLYIFIYIIHTYMYTQTRNDDVQLISTSQDFVVSIGWKNSLG